tara:strand:- start:349 stop:837 length:489 start_codon:yes stop_codon:yes gene_type:complete
MSFLDTLKTVFSGGSLIKEVGDVVDKFVTTGEEKLEATRLLEAAIHKHELDLKDKAMEAERLFLQDKQNARSMQMEALRQADNFSKRYVYFLASFVVLGAFSFGMGLMFYEIPPENKRMIEMFADIFLFSGALTVLNFFFGSSKGSAEKTSIIANSNKEKST